MKQKISTFILALFFFLFATLSGCNIFSWTDSPEEEQDLIKEGIDLMQDGEFDEAVLKFAEAMEQDSMNSDARYNHAKATLLASGESILTILNEIAKAENVNAPEAQLPFLGKPVADQNRIYKTNITIYDDLLPIFDGLTHGTFEPGDVTIDIIVSNTTVGMLRFADTNGDGEIAVPPDVDLSIFRGLGGDFQIEGLDTMAADPDLINSMITNIDNVLASNTDFILSMVDSSQIDTSVINGLLDDISTSSGMYFVNTGAPGNPGIGDNDLDGTTDEECLDGDDEDGDGLVDEDAVAPLMTNASGRVCP